MAQSDERSAGVLDAEESSIGVVSSRPEEIVFGKPFNDGQTNIGTVRVDDKIAEAGTEVKLGENSEITVKGEGLGAFDDWALLEDGKIPNGVLDFIDHTDEKTSFFSKKVKNGLIAGSRFQMRFKKTGGQPFVLPV